MRLTGRLFLALLVFVILAGCGTTLRKRNLEAMDRLAHYSGVVRHGSADDVLVIVLLVTPDQSMAGYTVADPTGRFEFLRPPGEYRILAWLDLDADFQWDEREPWVMTDEPAVDVGGLSGEVAASAITIPTARDDAPPLEVNLTLRELPSADDIRTAALGRVVSIEDPMLGPDAGVQSLWQPIEFLKEKNAGVFVLEAFDPSKTPVIFVNGIGGSPAEFRTLVSRLDRSRFQPVFLLYPSGLSIELNGWILERLAVEIRARRPNIGDTIVIAHSMGGLVARSMINRMVDAGSRHPIAFISISTPWLGHGASSELGARLAGVPVWADLAPGSSFLDSVFKHPLPDDLHYYLLFSYSGESALVKGSDDGTVTIPSMLPYEAQDQALLVYGLAESHVSILESEKTIELVLEILDREASRAARSD